LSEGGQGIVSSYPSPPPIPFNTNNNTNTDNQLENLISKNHYLNTSARDGYRSYLQSYASYSLKKIFDVNNLDLAKVGKAFGFNVPPKVNISVGSVKGGNGKKGGEESSDDEDEGGVVKKAYYRNRGHAKKRE
jgi:ATP-dependent RNA helicase DDX18/HAS1